MTNFFESIEAGIKTARDRERNFLEIHEVFTSLKDQILDYSEKLLTLELVIKNVEEVDTYLDYFINKDYLYNNKILFISIVGLETLHYHKLSDIDFSTNGYPCNIVIDGNKYDAIDKTGLEENIKILLSSSSTGQKLFDLLSKAKNIDEAL